jgi:hypothetical protein
MTISAPQGQKQNALSETKPAYLDETMEEVARPAARALHSDAPRHVATRTRRNDGVCAPLSAPRRRIRTEVVG